jgi:signal transduction histidine kinase
VSGLTPADHGDRYAPTPTTPMARRARSFPSWTDDTESMLRTFLWLARVVGFAGVGALVFSNPTTGPLARPAAIAGYVLIGLGLLTWALVDFHPIVARYRARWLPAILGVIAGAAGFACTPDHGDSMVAFAIAAAISAGSETSLLAGWAVAGVGALAIEAGGVIYSDGYGDLLGYPLLIFFGLLVGRNRGAYRIQAEQSAALLVQFEQLQAEQRRADVLDERARIAREIHDVLAHSLGALGIQIQAARAVLTDHRDIDRAVEVLSTAQRMAADGLVETRRAVHALRTDTLPLDEELAQVTGTHSQRHGTAVTFDIGGVSRPLPPEATIALLRMAQEALVNAAKHAPHQRIAVQIDYDERQVRLTLKNDLAEGHVDRRTNTSTVNGGYGLTGMQERLRLLNGTLAAGPHGDHWTVTAVLPNAAPAQPTPQPARLVP